MDANHIENLKTACSKTDIKIVDLLKKAHLAASEAADEEVINWVKNELHGYSKESSVPEYRKVKGKLAAYDSFQGWQILKSSNPEIKKEIDSIKIKESAPELESLVQKTQTSEAYLSQKLPREKQKELKQKLGVDVEFARVIEPEKAEEILQHLKNEIHMWAFNLEADLPDTHSQTLSKEIKFNLEQLKKAPEKELAQELEKISAELKTPTPDYQKISGIFSEFLKKL